MNKPEITVDHDARKELETILGAGHLSYCYQCGACVGDCPSARFYPGFNPRTIMLQALMGDFEDLLGEKSMIWLCSNCYNCYERCPQDVRPVEVIIALKNLCVNRKTAPEDIPTVSDHIRKTGRSVPLMPSVNRMRESLGLAPLELLDVSEIEEILKPEDDES